ncbi:MAG TPA: hypothetical protein GXX69_02375 [Firmicutes bacterium]|nr:hypothetical protein [Bacillota bacterium]
MLWLTQKSLHKKKITAFILSVLLLMTIVEPLPAWAEEKPVGPVIEAITPAQVSSAGGTVIQIKGTGLSSTTAVTIGGRPVEKISTVEDTVVEVIAPYGDAGTSSKLKLVRSDDKYAEATITYRESNPRIDEIVQDYGPVRGGTEVTIEGEELDNRQYDDGTYAIQVLFGGEPAVVLKVEREGLKVKVPEGSVGKADVTVINPDKKQAVKSEAFTYYVSPHIESITPNFGPTRGGTLVEIRGEHLDLTTNLLFGDKTLEHSTDTELEAGRYYISDDGKTIYAKTPGGQGKIDVIIEYQLDPSISDKTIKSTVVAGFQYQDDYIVPNITAVKPNAGSVTGGDNVVITGEDFISGAKVYIGEKELDTVRVVSTKEIEIKVPPAPKDENEQWQDGWYPITVKNPSPHGEFTYLNGFLYQKPGKALILNNVLPSEGPMGETTRVVLQGLNFEDNVGVRVYFGSEDREGIDVKCLSSTEIEASAPIYLSDELEVPVTVILEVTKVEKKEENEEENITVVELAELSSGFTYYQPVPVPEFVTKVQGKEILPIHNPETENNEGPVAGGVPVEIYARKLRDDCEVYFGPEISEEYQAQVDEVEIIEGEEGVSKVTVMLPMAPEGKEGATRVWLVNPPLKEGRKPGIAYKDYGFVYRGNNMELSSIRPTEGLISGGDIVEIVGTNMAWTDHVNKKQLLLDKTDIYFEDNQGRAVVTDGKNIEVMPSGEEVLRFILPRSTPGYKNVTVKNPFGERTLQRAFEYKPIPGEISIDEVFPLVGTTQGGTELVIKGEGFEQGDTVLIGNRLAQDVKVTLEQIGEPDSEEGQEYRTVITCTVPTNEPGTYPIRVIKKRGGKEDTYRYWYIYVSSPEISSLLPSSGTADGGTWVLVKGKGFLSKEQVETYVDHENEKIEQENEERRKQEIEELPQYKVSDLRVKLWYKDGKDLVPLESKDVEFISPTEIAFKTPSLPEKDRETSVHVEVINPDAVLASEAVAWGKAYKEDGFRYKVPQLSRPVIDEIEPDKGPISGGTKVLLKGNNFREDTTVYFKWKQATQVTRKGYDQLEVVTPPAPADWVGEGIDVVAVNAIDGGQSDAKPFHYVFPRTRPEFHSIVPDQGSVDGETLVTIRGYDLGNVEEVLPDETEDGDKENQSSKVQLIPPTVYFGDDKATIIDLNDERTVLRVKTPPHAAGTVDVRIMNPDSATVTAKNAYTYRYITTEPRIQTVEPKRGRASGGTPVVISGSGFSTGAKVYFNDLAARVDTAKSSETTLFVYSPPGKAGEKADITVLNPDGASDTKPAEFEYISDPRLQPRITQIVPNKGPVTGGVLVDIWGVNLKHMPDGGQEQLKVLLGHQSVEIIASSPDPDQKKADEGYVQYVQIEVPPVEKPGPVDVSVINADGGVFTVPGGFTYTEVTEPIEVDAIVPAKGPYLVNIPAQINGSGFLSGAKVFLGGQELAGCEVVNEGTAIIFTIPAAPKREDDLSLDVIVMNPNGATARIENGFTYVADPKSEPQITQVVPGSGRTIGGTPVVVHGQGFVEQDMEDGSKQASALFFGSRLATKTTFLSGEQLSAITPPGPVGPVNVTVINPDGAMDKLVSGFVYEDKPGPVITGLNPTSGPSAGGTEVVISGSQFDQGIEVSFGSVAARSVQRTSDTELVVLTPEGDLGSVDVTVTNPDGSSYTLPDAFTYVGPPKPPAGLEARAISGNTIELRWLAAVGAASYEIYAGESRSDQYFLASSTGEVYGAPQPAEDEPQILYYYVQDLEPDTRYYFSVRAVNKDGVSGQTWTASARTLKRSSREPEDIPAATDFTITRSGSAGVVITVPPTLLKDSRIRLDLMKPEYENTRTFTIILPAAEVDRRSTVYLSAPRLKLELPVRAVNSVEVRSLSRREREQASVHVTIEEARGPEVVALLKRLPSGWATATPIYRLTAKIISGGQEKELTWLAERITLTTKFDFANLALQQSTLHYYDPTRDIWIPAGFFTTWSTDAAFDRPGYWVVLSQTV